jgi:ketosteroid isomerase-like protein
MTPKELTKQWVDAFNNTDAETISNFYAENAINHQVANGTPVTGKEDIIKYVCY